MCVMAPPIHLAAWSMAMAAFCIIIVLSTYSATREDDTTFIFSHFGLFLSDAASNLHK